MQSIIARVALMFIVGASFFMGILMSEFYAEGMEFEAGLCVAAIVLFISQTWDLTRE